MALNRLTGLGVLLGTSMLMAVACDSGGDSNNNNNGVGGSAGETGGTSSTSSSSKATGGSATTKTTAKATGGKQSTTTTGDEATGGADSTDTSTDCTGDKPLSGADNCKAPTYVDGQFANKKNYASVGPYAGYGFTYISASGDAKSTSCPTTTAYFPTTSTALCGAGTVPADCTYGSVGGVGFNLAQTTKGGTDSAKAITDTVTSIHIEFANTAQSGLHIQIVQNAEGTETGGTNYCFEASSSESPLDLQASDFTTACWDAAAPGDPWDGTGAQSVQMIVPSTADKAVDFDLCLTNLTFNE